MCRGDYTWLGGCSVEIAQDRAPFQRMVGLVGSCFGLLPCQFRRGPGLRFRIHGMDTSNDAWVGPILHPPCLYKT